MATIEQACLTCHTGINDVFDPSSGSRKMELIAGSRSVTEQCFVADEIRFQGDSQLIFSPVSQETGASGEYHSDYFVICRKLVVEGGKAPAGIDPCGPDDPGHTYSNNNVITWEDRLKEADPGADKSPLSPGTSYDRNAWSDMGQGNHGMDGGEGDPGEKGNNGNNGGNAPNITLVALEVEIGFGDNLAIDFDGQNGGQGGRGQESGDGGDGMGGRNGDSDTSWPGIGCDRQPGHGGYGGDGGAGGEGGEGGVGGRAGNITVITTKNNMTASGAFVSGHIHYVNDGGDGGKGGRGGCGGKGGKGGKAGFKTQECDEASAGQNGNPGYPTPPCNPQGSTDNMGIAGSNGAGGDLDFVEIKEDTCADLIPLPIKIDSGPDPDVFCRGNTAVTEDSVVTGENLSQVTSVEVSGLANVTTTIKPSSDDSQLDLKFIIAGDSGLGNGDLIFHPDFGSSETLTSAIEVRMFEVIGLTPGSGARNSIVAVTITGTCFDPGATLQQVTVSGTGVNVEDIVVVDSETITCNFNIGLAAPTTSRDVTVRIGGNQQTLTGAFTVTS